MGKFTGDSKKLLEYVGGRENIAAVSHCVTRMRFVLNDPSKADTEAIESLSSAKGTFTQAGQFQVIIGNEVSTFYNDFAEVAGIEGVSKEAVKKAAMAEPDPYPENHEQSGRDICSLDSGHHCRRSDSGIPQYHREIALFDGGTKTLTQISVFWAGINSFLWLIGEAVFHFLPVCIVWSITKKMGTTQALGIVLGITLVSPQLLNAYSVATTAAAEIPKWNFGLFQVDMIGYQAQVLPAVLAWLYPGLPGAVLQKNMSCHDFHDCGPLLLPADIRGSGPRHPWTHWLEDWRRDFRLCERGPDIPL